MKVSMSDIAKNLDNMTYIADKYWLQHGSAPKGIDEAIYKRAMSQSKDLLEEMENRGLFVSPTHP